MAKEVRGKLTPGETLFGGGAGVILVGSRRSSSGPSSAETTESPTPEQVWQQEQDSFARSSLRFLGVDPNSPTESPDPAASKWTRPALGTQLLLSPSTSPR